MKKILATMLAAVLALSMAGGAMAEVTLRTTSTFAGTDAGAQAYVDLLNAWEEETGNKVDDASATSDEAWKAGVQNDFAAGNEPDVLFYFANTADSKPILDKVVPISEINEAYPDLNLAEDDALREEDGVVYAIPVRFFWEGLFVNVDLFEAHGLELPTDVEKFETAVATFKENGIVPIGISLSDIPHYLVEFVILSEGPVADHEARPKTEEELPASWVEGMALINHLYEIGAFPENVNSTTEDLTTQMFLDKQAAMLLDGSWRANGIGQENWDTTMVMPFPAYSDTADATAIPGGVSMGFYISRKAWDDETKRDAAVSLLSHLTSDDAKEKLGFTFGGELLNSATAMFDAAHANDAIVTPIGDVMDIEVRNYWFSQIPALADGTADPQTVMDEVITRGAF